MPIHVPLIPFIRRRRRAAFGAATPPALMLVEAVLESFEDDPRVRLTFDRAIDVAEFDPSQVSVNDPTGSAFLFVGMGVFDVPDAQSVVVALVADGPATGTVTVLNASAATGIVASDDGGTWAGVEALVLP